MPSTMAPSPHEEDGPVFEQMRTGPNTANSGSTSHDDDETLRRTQTGATTASVRERRFEEIRTGDREELNRIATTLARTQSIKRISTSDGADLEKKDTLYGVQVGDSVLDPASPDFDVYKWARM